MAHFVNPFTDIGFKIIFGQPASKELLITLLNELLAGEHHIEDLTFIDKEDNSDNVNDRGIIFDLYCPYAVLRVPCHQPVDRTSHNGRGGFADRRE